MHLYNSEQEKRDIDTLNRMKFEVVNPNTPEMQEEYEQFKKQGTAFLGMAFFEDVVRRCDVFAFRAHIDGKIPSGVGAELEAAKRYQKPILELPSLHSSRFLSREDTVEYLKLCGER